ncbi:MAG: flagellar basal body rod protein FlgB [Candidatus Nealsonbacteria bacterium]|nr:flagellar basal body rod protein FlgB [Candidatus Nealsonbacteria bacterium]
MFSSMFQSSTIPLLEEVVTFSQSRHKVLAANIANLDTPGYEVRDLSVEDFQERLREAVAERRRPPIHPSLAGVAEGYLSPGEIGGRDRPLMAEISEDPKTILYHDKSNVGIEYQVTEMVKNQGRHNLALTLMSNQFQLLQTAISGRL